LGTLVVSLDFELHWGLRDVLRVEQYRENLLGVRRAIPAMLDLFAEFGIRATWATVGFLFFESLDDLLAASPGTLPCYDDRKLDPYAALGEVGKNEAEDPFHFAPSLIRLIHATAGQELATHTFSHFYVRAAGPSLDSFRADLCAAKSVARRFGIDIKSIVFPRNEISAPHLRICAEAGIIAYRGVQTDPFIAAGNGMIHRAKRLVDHYLDLSGPCCGIPAVSDDLEMVSVPQSRFLRPYRPTVRTLEDLRLRRITSAMTFAARNDLLFHLWWHPHNFGAHTEGNLAFLRRILEHYRFLSHELNFSSRTIGEVAEAALATPKSRLACRES
jgi:hypothetical protein